MVVSKSTPLCGIHFALDDHGDPCKSGGDLRIPRTGAFEMFTEMDGIYGDLKAFIARANEELRRARRYATFVSLIAIDLSHIDDEGEIENFSGFDEFMLSMQKLVRNSIRETDLLSASGNKGIYILLIETPGEGAQAVSQRLQSSLRYFICNNIRSPIKWRAPMKSYSFPQSIAGQPDLQSLLGELE